MTETVGFVLIALGVLVLFVLGSRRQRRNSALKLKPSPLPSKQDEQLDVLAELERANQTARARAKGDEKTRRWLRPFGVFGRLVTYGALFLALYIFSPKDISNAPLGSLTLSDIVGTVGFILIGLFLIKALFEPSENDEVKDAWGWLGVLTLGLAISALFYFRA
jgi:hypothetical protein